VMDGLIFAIAILLMVAIGYSVFWDDDADR
jgi:hypothetical protein